MSYSLWKKLMAYRSWQMEAIFSIYTLLAIRYELLAITHRLYAASTINLSLYPKSGLLHSYGCNFQHCSLAQSIAVFLYE